MREKPGQYIDSESPFCRNCTRDDCPTNGDGCKAWETYFIDNWNKNIMKSIGNHKKQRQFSSMNTRIWRERGLLLSMSKAKMYGCFTVKRNCTPPRWRIAPPGNKGKQNRKEMKLKWQIL